MKKVFFILAFFVLLLVAYQNCTDIKLIGVRSLIQKEDEPTPPLPPLNVAEFQLQEIATLNTASGLQFQSMVVTNNGVILVGTSAGTDQNTLAIVTPSNGNVSYKTTRQNNFLSTDFLFKLDARVFAASSNSVIYTEDDGNSFTQIQPSSAFILPGSIYVSQAGHVIVTANRFIVVLRKTTMGYASSYEYYCPISSNLNRRQSECFDLSLDFGYTPLIRQTDSQTSLQALVSNSLSQTFKVTDNGQTLSFSNLNTSSISSGFILVGFSQILNKFLFGGNGAFGIYETSSLENPPQFQRIPNTNDMQNVFSSFKDSDGVIYFGGNRKLAMTLNNADYSFRDLYIRAIAEAPDESVYALSNPRFGEPQDVNKIYKVIKRP